MSEELAMNNFENDEYNDIAEDSTTEAEEVTEQSGETDLEVTAQPNAVFRRALLGGYKTVDVDNYIEQTKEVLQTTLEENKLLKIKIDALRDGSITMKTALSSSLRFSENISDTARRETASLVENAQHAAKRYEQETANLAGSLSQEIEALRLQRDRISSDLSATMESHIRLLDTIDMNSMSQENRDKANDLLNLG